MTLVGHQTSSVSEMKRWRPISLRPSNAAGLTSERWARSSLCAAFRQVYLSRADARMLKKLEQLQNPTSKERTDCLRVRTKSKRYRRSRTVRCHSVGYL